MHSDCGRYTTCCICLEREDRDFQAGTLGSLVQAKNIAAHCLWSVVHVLILPVPNTFYLHVFWGGFSFFGGFSNFFPQSKKMLTGVSVSAMDHLSGAYSLLSTKLEEISGTFKEKMLQLDVK